MPNSDEKQFFPEATASAEDRTAIAAKVAFLSSTASYRHEPQSVDVIETHMAYVFLAG